MFPNKKNLIVAYVKSFELFLDFDNSVNEITNRHLQIIIIKYCRWLERRTQINT